MPFSSRIVGDRDTHTSPKVVAVCFQGVASLARRSRRVIRCFNASRLWRRGFALYSFFSKPAISLPEPVEALIFSPLMSPKSMEVCTDMSVSSRIYISTVDRGPPARPDSLWRLDQTPNDTICMHVITRTRPYVRARVKGLCARVRGREKEPAQNITIIVDGALPQNEKWNGTSGITSIMLASGSDPTQRISQLSCWRCIQSCCQNKVSCKK